MQTVAHATFVRVGARTSVAAVDDERLIATIGSQPALDTASDIQCHDVELNRLPGLDVSQNVARLEIAFGNELAIGPIHHPYPNRGAIAEKVNQLIDVGARVALDDFGAGRDGLERLYAIRRTTAVKIDREFLLTYMHHDDGRRMLCMLVAQWRQAGVPSIAEGVETRRCLPLLKRSA